MSFLLGAAQAVAKPFKTLIIDRIAEYLKFIKSYEENMTNLVNELRILSAKKLDLAAKVKRDEANQQVMTRETGNWLRSLMDLIEREEMRQLMKEERVAEIVVKMMERRVLKKLWKEDREIFDIVVDVVKKNSNHQRIGDGEVVDAEESDDYNKVAKIASDVMKDIADEFTKFIKGDDAAAAVVKLLNNVDLQNVDLEKLRKDGDEMAMILSKGEGIIRKEVGHNHDDEEELLIPKHDEDVQPVTESFIKEKVKSLRQRMGRLMAFLDDENFKKGLPDGARLGLEVITALSNSSGSDHAVENSKPHRYCGYCTVRFEVNRRHHDMSERAVTMIEAIKSAIDGCPPEPLTRPIRDDELENIPGEFIEGLESREVVLQGILTALKNDQVNIVGVYGMGGCGKTTLAKEVAYKRTSDLFDRRVVVEVSETPNIKSIQNQIAGGIDLTFDDQHNVSQRARILYNKLNSGKILIILDNIWKKLKLDQVGIPLESTKDSCCKVLITTREEHVCRLMNVQEANIFKVGLLNKREALKLFENQTEKKVSNREFKPVADKLLLKCGGLPLAIATTASALRGKDLPMWCHFAETSEKPITSQVSSEYRETYSILETSYKLIENEEKRIFLFLVCLSPLDSAVTIDDLTRYGIGLDLFQHVNGLSEAIEQATTWGNELISSSLLLKGDSHGEVKIHDLVRASFISFINKGNDRVILVESIPRWMSQQTFKKLKAISLLSSNDFSRLSGVKAPILQILLLKGDVSSTSLPSDFFVGMKNLKILSLSNINFSLGLPESMGHLERLKTLHLHNCKLKDIKLIGKLVNLLVLSLRGSSLEELAIEIGDLCKLRLLDLEGCKGMINIPANILSRLSHLEGLYMLNGFDGWASTNIEVNPKEGDDKASGSELDTLSHMNVLETEVSEVAEGSGSELDTRSHLNALETDLPKGGYDHQASGSELDTLSHLNVLEMEVSKVEQLLTANNGQYVEQLGKFKIRVGNFPIWDWEEISECRYILGLMDINTVDNNWLRAVLKKADCFLLMNCPSFIENLVPLFNEDGFKNLRTLFVEDCNFKCIVSSSDQDESMVFANLQHLRVNCMDNLEMICDGRAPAGLFSNLQRLFLVELPKLKCGLPLTSIRHNLSEIDVTDCKSLEFIFNKDTILQEDEAEIILFPHLKSIKLMDVQRLSSVVGRTQSEMMHTIEYLSQDRPFFDEMIKFQSLEILKLSINETIVTLWSTASDISSFQNLKNLKIDGCSKLRSLGPPSIFAVLVQLEHLSICRCKKLQEVITKETEGNGIRECVIAFPQLKHLCLDDLDHLERFYGGSYKLEFPKLESLKLSYIRKMTNFDGSEISTSLFSDKIEFPCLEELHVLDLSSEVVRLWNWSSSGVQRETESSSNSSDPVPSLQKLQVSFMHGLMSIPHFVSRKLTHLDVSYQNDVKYLFSVSPLNREVFWSYSQLPNLADLTVGGYDYVEQLFENEDDNAVVMLCEHLNSIDLYHMPKMKILPWHLLKNIRTLCVFDLSWKYLFSADLFTKGREQLQQLEYLDISQCEDMEVVIMDELAGDGEDTVYCFPRLKELKLFMMNITKFVSKPNTGLHFQSLQSIDFSRCDQMHSFCSGPFRAPKLEDLELSGCKSMEYFLSDEMNEVRELPSLTKVRIDGCLTMLSFSSKPLIAPKLHYVALEKSGEMRWFSPGDPNCGDILDLPSLEWVTIEKCWGMQSFSYGGINAPYLCQVMVDKEDYSKRTNENLQDLLQNLPNYHKR